MTTMLVGSLCVQGAQALMGHDNFGNYDIGPRSIAKAIFKGTLGVSAVAVGVIGGGYYGMMGAGKLTENYYKRNGDPNKLGTWNIGLSMLGGAFVGAAVGGCVATAVSVKALDLF
jgi:hypothetical protein